MTVAEYRAMGKGSVTTKIPATCCKRCGYGGLLLRHMPPEYKREVECLKCGVEPREGVEPS